MFLQLVVVLMMQFSVLNSVTFGMIFSFSRDIYTRDLTRNKKQHLNKKFVFLQDCVWHFVYN